MFKAAKLMSRIADALFGVCAFRRVKMCDTLSSYCPHAMRAFLVPSDALTTNCCLPTRAA
eukprot:scaffold279656_cov30-Tisochrysis_lutea.AAC.1